MSGRKSKRTQKFGSSRRNRHNRDTEGRDDDDGFPHPENEEHKSEHNDFYPVSEKQPAVAHQPGVVCTDQPTSTSELPHHSQSVDLVAPVEMASRRKMGSSRKSRGVKFKGVAEEDPEHRQETTEGISGEVIEEMAIKEVEIKHDYNQPGLSVSLYHESSTRQEEDVALCNITAIKDVPGNDEYQHLELATESQTISNCSYELDQSKEMALEQELMRQTRDSSLLTPTHLPPHEFDDSLEIYNQTETFCERVITYTDQEDKTEQSQGLLSEKQEERQDVHTILNTKHVQPSLNFMDGNKQELEAMDTLHFTSHCTDATVILSVNEQEQQDLNDPERGLCSIKDETKATQEVTETETVTGEKCSTKDYDHIDNSLKLMDDTEKQPGELGHIYENTEFSESTDKNMEVYVVENRTDSELHEEVVEATHLKQNEAPYTNIVLSPKLTNQAEQPSLEKHLLHELESLENNETSTTLFVCEESEMTEILTTTQNPGELDREADDTVVIENICTGVDAKLPVPSDIAEPLDTEVHKLQSKMELTERIIQIKGSILEGQEDSGSMLLEDSLLNVHDFKWTELNASEGAESDTVRTSYDPIITSVESVEEIVEDQLPESIKQDAIVPFEEEANVLISTSSHCQKIENIVNEDIYIEGGHQREDEYDSEFRHFIGASSAEKDNAKQEDYLKQPGNEEACSETKNAKEEIENNVMESSNSYQFVMYPSVASEINPAESLCKEMQTDSILYNDLGDFPSELEMHPKNHVSADLPPDSCQLPEDRHSQDPTFCNVGHLQLNDSTVNQEEEKEKYTPDNRSEEILEKIEPPENLYDSIDFSRGEQEATGDNIMSDETVELKAQDRLTPSKEHNMLLVSDSLNEDTNTEKVQQEEGNAIRSADQLFSTERLEINTVCVEEDVKHESYRNQKSEEADILQARGDKIDDDDDDTEITHENIPPIYSMAAEDNASQTLEKEAHCSEVSAAIVTPPTPPFTDIHSISYKYHVTKSSCNLPSDSLTEDEESKSTKTLPENNETSTTLFVCEESEMTEILTTTQNPGELDREADDTVVIGNICTGVDAKLAVPSDIAEPLDTEVHKLQSKTELTERIIQIKGSILEGQEDSGSMLLEDSLLNVHDFKWTELNASEGAESDTVRTSSDPIITTVESVEEIVEDQLPESIKQDAIIPFKEDANVLISTSSHCQKIENIVNEDMYERGGNVPLIHSSNILSTENMSPEKKTCNLKQETNAGPTENFTREDMVSSEDHIHSALSSQTTEQGLPTNLVQLPETEYSDSKKDENMSGENGEKKDEEHARNQTKKKRFGSKRRIQRSHQGTTEGQEREWKEVEGSEGVSLEVTDPVSTLSLLNTPQNAMTDVSSDVQVTTLTTKQMEMVESKEEIGECGRIATLPVLSAVVFESVTVTFDKVNNADEFGEHRGQHGKPDVRDTRDGEFTSINEKDMIPVIEDASTDHISMYEHSMESTENERTSQIQGNSASIPEELSPETQNILIMSDYEENIVAVVSDQDQSKTEDHLKEPEQLASTQPVVQMQQSNSAQDSVIKENSGFSISRQKRKMGSTRKNLRGKIMEGDQTDTFEAIKGTENIQEKATEIRPPVSEEDHSVAEALSVVPECNQSIERHSETSEPLSFMPSKADMGLRNDNNTENLQEYNVTLPALFTCEENKTELITTQNPGECDREEDGTVVIRKIYEGIDVTPTTPSDVAEHLDTEVHKGQNKMKSIENTIQNEKSETEHSGSKEDNGTSSENVVKHDVKLQSQIHTKKKKFGSTRRVQGRHQGHAEGKEREQGDIEDKEGDEQEIMDPTTASNLLTKPYDAVTDVSSGIQVPTLTFEQKELTESKNESKECEIIHVPPVLSNVVLETDTSAFEVNDAEVLGEPGQSRKPGVDDTGNGEFTYLNEQQMLPVITENHASTEAKQHGMESTENENTSQVHIYSICMPVKLSPETRDSSILEVNRENFDAVLSDKDHIVSKDHLQELLNRELEPEQFERTVPVVRTQESKSAQDNVTSISRPRRKMGSTRKSLRGKIMEGDHPDTFEAIKGTENIQEQATEIRPPVSEEDHSVAEALIVVPECNQSIERHSETSEPLSFMPSKADMGLRNDNNTENLQEYNVTLPALVTCEENKTELITTQNPGECDREEDGTVVIRNIYEGIDVTPTTPSDVAEHLDTEVHKGQNKMKSIENIIQNEKSETEHSGSKEDNGTSSENVVKHDVKLQAHIHTKKKKFGSTRRVQGRHQGHAEGKEREQGDIEDKEGDEQEIMDPTTASNLLTKPYDAVTDVSSGIQVPTLTFEQKELTESKNESKECEIIHVPPVLSNVVLETDTSAFEVNDAEVLGEPGQSRKPGVDDTGNGEFTYLNEQQMLPVITENHASTEAKQHGMESTENENTSQVHIYSICMPVKLSPETRGSSILEVNRENFDAVLSDKDHIVSEDHLQELLNRELEPEQFERTVPVVRTQESKSAQDNVTSISRPRRKMGSTRKSLRGKIPEDDQTDTFVIKERENIQEQATDHSIPVSEKKDSEAETPSIIPEASHQSIERHSEASESHRHPETGVSTVSVFHDTATTLGSVEPQNHDKLVEGSLLSEIASELKKSYQSPLITIDPNVSHLIADSTSNSPLEARASQPDIPEISESMCEQNKDTHQVSPSPRRRKMGSTRKIGRNMPTEKRNNDSDEHEIGTEDMDMNKNDKNCQNERETEACIKVKVTEEIKGSVQPSSESQAASHVLESSTSEKGHSLPGGKRKFGSRRTAKDRGGVGALAPGSYDTIQRNTDSNGPNNDLLVCDPHFISGPGNTSASQHGGMEASPRTEEIIKPTVKATDTPTGTGLVSLGDIRKSSPSVGSTRERQKLDLEQWNEPIPDFGQAVYNVVMVGNSNVGKTSFIRRLQNGHFNTDYSATIGVDTFVQTVTLGNKTVKLYVWDTAGQERYHSITRQVFHKAQGLLLMYDITSSQSFHAVRDWIYQVQEKASDDVIMMLLGNKNDCVKREVQLEEGEDLSKEFDIHFMECSAATGENVSECMKTLAWLLVKQRVRKEEEHTILQPKPTQKKSGCC